MLYEYLHKHFHFKVETVHFSLAITAMIWNHSNCQKLRYNDVTKITVFIMAIMQFELYIHP